MIMMIMMLNASQVAAYHAQWYNKRQRHISLFSGERWVAELLEGHPRRMRSQLGIHAHVFLRLVIELDLRDSKFVGRHEQLAIFLFICHQGQSGNHACERFQRSGDTISKYFYKVLNLVVSPTFYQRYVSLPKGNEATPREITSNAKYRDFFQDCIGAIDGTKIAVKPPSAEAAAYRDYKTGISQNVLAVCSFDMRFLYVMSGWEGTAADAALWAEARRIDLEIPQGKYFLADAGFGACDSLLVPFPGERYHLREWYAGSRYADIIDADNRSGFQDKYSMTYAKMIQ